MKSVTVNGKTYLFGSIRRAGNYGSTTVPHDYVGYFGTRNGERFGPIRHGARNDRPGTVGRAVFDAAEQAEAAEQAAPLEGRPMRYAADRETYDFTFATEADRLADEQADA